MAPKKKGAGKKGKDGKKAKGDKKKAKGDKKKAKGDKKKKETSTEKVAAPDETKPSILDKEIAKNLGKLGCIILTLISIALTIAFQQAYTKFKEVPDAMSTLRAIMEKHNKSLEGKPDEEILQAAEEMAQHVVNRRSDIADLKYELEYTRRLIHEGWRIYNRTYWYFTKPIPYEDWVKECTDKGLKLDKIEDIFFQTFLEKQLPQFHTGIWIPIKKSSRGNTHEWYWEVDQTLVTKMFWEDGQPSRVPNAFCCEIKFPCTTPNYCWHDISCNKRNVGFCRGREVDPRFLLS